MSFFHIDDDGGVLTEADGITTDDLQSGHLVYRDDDGAYYSADGDGGLYELDPALAAYDLSMLDDVAATGTHDEPAEEELSEAGQHLIRTFLERNGGDAAAAAQELDAYIEALEATEAAQHAPADKYEPGTEAGEQFLTEWAEDHPGAVGDPRFRAFFQKTGDLDKAYALWKRGNEVIAEERGRTGGEQTYKTWDHAFAAWDAEKEAAKEADTTAAPRSGNDVRDAIDDWMTSEVKPENDLRKAARARLEGDRIIRSQELKGRG